jgi:hypothetical protein
VANKATEVNKTTLGGGGDKEGHSTQSQQKKFLQEGEK